MMDDNADTNNNDDNDKQRSNNISRVEISEELALLKRKKKLLVTYILKTNILTFYGKGVQCLAYRGIPKITIFTSTSSTIILGQKFFYVSEVNN